MKRTMLTLHLLLLPIVILAVQLDFFWEQTWWACFITIPLAIRVLYALVRIEFETRFFYFKILGAITIALNVTVILMGSETVPMIVMTSFLFFLGEWFLTNHLLFKILDFFIGDSWWRKVIDINKQSKLEKAKKSATAPAEIAELSQQ